MRQIALILIALLLLDSCSSREEKVQKGLKAIWGSYLTKDFSQNKELEVLVVTNRRAKSEKFGCSDQEFGIKFNADLKFGICKINVPKNHNVGAIDLATSQEKSRNDYFKIISNKELSQKALIKKIAKTKNTPLIFVHGFNVHYQDAVLRASQIAYDLKYQGPIILFTWPSGAKDGFFAKNNLKKTYKINSINARVTVDIFQDFLSQLQQNKIKANLIVHSMGHQIVLPALNKLAQKYPRRIFVNQLILNAPDFDAKELKKIAKNVRSTSKRTTLYCSHNDKAIVASESLNKNKRAGTCVNIAGIDVINVGLIYDSTFDLGHSYYSSREVITDLFQTILEIDVSKRLFIKKAKLNSDEQYFLRK